MGNYRIYYEEGEKNRVISVLRRHNDIIIDNIAETSVGITIEREDAESFYRDLLEEIDREVYSSRL